MNDNFWAILSITLCYIAWGLLCAWMAIEATGGF